MPFKEISPAQAKEILKTPSSMLVDIRDEESFNRGHANEAYNLTQDNVPEFLNKVEKDTQILVLCYHGNSSQVVADYLYEEGFPNVYSIIGGYEAWNKE